MPGKKNKKKAHRESTTGVHKVGCDVTKRSPPDSGAELHTADTSTAVACISDTSRNNALVEGSSDNASPGVQSAFQQELDWCITQLELGLSRSEASKAQKEQSRKYIKTLKSPKNPLPRRRQLMRQLFGDYRAKMKSNPLPPKLNVGTIHPGIAVTDKQKRLNSGKFYKPCAKCDPQSTDKSPFFFMFDVDDST